MAQTVATCVVWVATMVIFVKGIFAANCHDQPALIFGAFAVAMVSSAAAASTAFIWRGPGRATTPIAAPAKLIAEDEWAQV